MQTSRRALAAIFCGALLLAPSSSFADATADRKRALALMKSGDAKRKEKDFKGALEDFKEADKLAGVVTTALEVARVQVDLNRLADAQETLERLLHMPEAPSDPEVFKDARTAAQQLNAELSSRIPTVKIVLQNVDPAMATQASIDDVNIPPAALNAPQKVNPGPHVVVAKVGTAELKQEIDVPERENKEVTFDFKDEAGATQAPATSGKSKVLLISGFSVALIGVGVGSVTGLMSLSKTSDLDTAAKCPDHKCPRKYEDELSSAKTLGNIATIAFIVGGVGLATGIVGLVTAGSSKKEAPANPPATAKRPSVFSPEQVRAVLGPSYVGISGAF